MSQQERRYNKLKLGKVAIPETEKFFFRARKGTANRHLGMPGRFCENAHTLRILGMSVFK